MSIEVQKIDILLLLVCVIYFNLALQDQASQLQSYKCYFYFYTIYQKNSSYICEVGDFMQISQYANIFFYNKVI